MPESRPTSVTEQEKIADNIFPMKTVYLVRHGESTENVRSTNIFQGGAASLTKHGQKQAQHIADRAKNLTIEVIISSPYKRAMQTASAVAETVRQEIIESDIFVEHVPPTSFTGQEWNDDLRLQFKKWQTTAFTENERYQDGENFEDLLKRAKSALAFLEARKEEHIFVVTHGMFCRVIAGLVMLQEEFLPADLKKFDHTLITRNTGITVIRQGADDPRKLEGMWHMLTWNDHAHLG
jgi:2,3-bisphosphoglycerate-dependent phosphoglycerate mutase